jgi:plasmid maintenance system antidote protein VapI
MEREVLRVERETAIRLRDQAAISDEVLRHIQRDLDLEELRIEDDDEVEGLA